MAEALQQHYHKTERRKEMTILLFVISLVVATIIVNAAQQMYMKLIGADMMFFSGKKKLIAIFLVGLVICGAILKLFGLDWKHIDDKVYFVE